ncbi:MAG: LAGLIDADG family homing endonuclease [bacterium]|nr:LAGLIDADG family homing endonuclease [bacterium]
MKNLSPEYVVGLVDGEGSFTVYVRNPDIQKKVARRVVVEPKFYIKLIERDKEILLALQRFFGCGSVYFQKDTRPNHQHCYRYEVFRWEELQTTIIPFFKQHTLKFASKRSDFEMFCLIMDLLSKKVHRTDRGLRKLFQLKQQMH